MDTTPKNERVSRLAVVAFLVLVVVLGAGALAYAFTGYGTGA